MCMFDIHICSLKTGRNINSCALDTRAVKRNKFWSENNL